MGNAGDMAMDLSGVSARCRFVYILSFLMFYKLFNYRCKEESTCTIISLSVSHGADCRGLQGSSQALLYGQEVGVRN